METTTDSTAAPLDRQSVEFLNQITEEEKVRANRIPGVRTVLVVLSTAGMVFDLEALRQKLIGSYPDAAVFFEDTQGNAMGAAAPHQVDLLIDFTDPDHRSGILRVLGLRRRSRVSIGRNTGILRRKIFDRVFNEFAPNSEIPADKMSRERFVQKRLLGMAGVVFSHSGVVPEDLSGTLARNLPPMKNL